MILPPGGEWLLDAGDGFGQVDVRLLLRTDDDVPIYMRYTGLMDFNEVVQESSLRASRPNSATITSSRTSASNVRTNATPGSPA